MGRKSDTTIFILSPANSGGPRAQLLFNPRAGFDLAHRLQRGEAIAIGEVFSFLSGLYFRGKRAYAARFARPPQAVPGGLVITSNRGILPVESKITLAELQAFSTTDIDARQPEYLGPLMRDAVALRDAAPGSRVVLLGSIGTKKYAEPLIEVFGERLLFPTSFVGRGDMSRGGLLLRSVAEDKELDYAPVAGSIRHGKRPERLAPRSRGFRVLDGNLPAKPKSPAKRGRKL